MTTLTVMLGLATLSLGLIDAWLAGRLARRRVVDQRLTEAGVAMLLTLILATLGVASTFVTVVLVAVGPTASTGQWLWVPSIIACFEGLSAILVIYYARAPQTPYRRGTAGGGTDLSNADPGVLAVLAILLFAFSVASVPVWLVARASAKQDGVDLGYFAAFQINRLR